MDNASGGKITWDLNLEAGKFKAGLAEAKLQAGGLGDHVSNVGQTIERGLKAAAVGLLAATTAAVAFGVSSVKAFSESQDTVAQLNATLASTKGVAGVTADAAIDLSKSLQKSTKYSDEQVLSGENLLLTFTNIGKDIFPRATEALLDMSTTMHQDVGQSAIQLGKALQFPIEGMAALSRTGALNRDDMDKLKQKWENEGTPVYQQQIDLLQALEKEFKGSSKAAGDTFSGSLAKLKNNFNDVQEAIGGAIVKGLSPLAQKMADFVASDKFQKWMETATAWMSENLPKAAKWITETLLPGLKQGFDDVWPVVKTVLKWMGDLFGFINDNQWIIWALVGAFAAVKTAMFLQGALEAFSAVISGAGTVYAGFTAVLASPIILPALAIGAVLGSIAIMVKSFLDARQTLLQTKDAIQGDINTMQNAVDKLTNSLKGAPAEAQRAQNALLKLGVPQSKINQTLLGTGATYAEGTDFAPGGLALVGERGPELVNLPRGSQVFTSQETRRMVTPVTGEAASGAGLGRSGATVNQTNNIYNNIDMEQGLRDLAWRLQN